MLCNKGLPNSVASKPAFILMVMGLQGDCDSVSIDHAYLVGQLQAVSLVHGSSIFIQGPRPRFSVHLGTLEGRKASLPKSAHLWSLAQ